MILRLRTKENLDAIEKRFYLGAYKISDSKIEIISHVEIFNWEGSQLISAEFDKTQTEYQTKLHGFENKRRVIAFNNPIIIDLQNNRHNF